MIKMSLSNNLFFSNFILRNFIGILKIFQNMSNEIVFVLYLQQLTLSHIELLELLKYKFTSDLRSISVIFKTECRLSFLPIEHKMLKRRLKYLNYIIESIPSCLYYIIKGKYFYLPKKYYCFNLLF